MDGSVDLNVIHSAVQVSFIDDDRDVHCLNAKGKKTRQIQGDTSQQKFHFGLLFYCQREVLNNMMCNPARLAPFLVLIPSEGTGWSKGLEHYMYCFLESNISFSSVYPP